MTALAMDGTGPTERRQPAVNPAPRPYIWDSEYDAWNAESGYDAWNAEHQLTAWKGTEGHPAPSQSSLALATDSRVVFCLGQRT